MLRIEAELPNARSPKQNNRNDMYKKTLSVLIKKSRMQEDDISKETNHNGLTPAEIESHLHEQYAINNKANGTNYIALLTALIAVFAGYGYVLYNYKTSYLNNGEEILWYTTIAVHVVLCILHAVAIEIASGQRSNQFIIDNIRRKAYTKVDYNAIFPVGYKPDGKGFYTFVQSIYNVLTISFFIVALLLCFSTIFLIDNYCCCIFIISPLFMYFNRFFTYVKYKEKEFNNEKQMNVMDE